MMRGPGITAGTSSGELVSNVDLAPTIAQIAGASPTLAVDGRSLLPFAVGEARPQEVAEVIERLWGGPETLFVLSTDLSHYHDYERARAIDQATLARIASFDTDLNHEEACGATPLNGFLAAARARGLSIRLLGACNSGDTAGGKDRVVGYSAFAFYEGAHVSLEDAGTALLDIAHGAISHRLGLAPEAPLTDAAAWLTRPWAL